MENPFPRAVLAAVFSLLALPGMAQDGVTAGAEAKLTVEGALRSAENPFWDAPLWKNDQRWAPLTATLHVEQPGQWAMLLHGDYYDQTPGWYPTNLVWPRPGNAFPLEGHFLTQAWLKYDFHPLQIEVGRDRVHWGPLDNALLISDKVPFLDMVKGSIQSPQWGLDWIVSTPETRQTADGPDVKKTVLLNLHRLEYRTEDFTFGVSEVYLVNRSASGGPFVLADLFPVGVWHQLDMNPNNNSLDFDVEWAPTPGFRVMAQYGLDEVDARTFGMPDDPIPTIWALHLGAEWKGTAWEGDAVVHGEAGYDHYLWGNFGDPVAQARYLLIQHGRTEELPLTSPYGPGTAWVDLKTRWTRDALELGARLEVFVRHAGVDFSTAYVDNPSLAGLGSDWGDRLTLSAAYTLAPGQRLLFEPSQKSQGGTTTLEARIAFEQSWSNP